MKLGIVSDAHGHVEAFQIALDVLGRRGAEQIYFLGDAVGYLPGLAVVERLRGLSGVQNIAGNHETMLLDGSASRNRDAVYQLSQTAEVMDGGHFEFLRAWPRRREMKAPCGDVIFVHGSPIDETFGYVYPQTELSQFGVSPGTTVFMGHTHHPFIRKESEAIFVNVGSCGLPRDCGHLGAACLFDSITGEVEILRFHIGSATESALRRCGTVHPSVVALFRRMPSGPVVGTLVDG